MKRLGNIVSGICLLMCGGVVLKGASDGVTSTLDDLNDFGSQEAAFDIAAVAVFGTIGYLLATTGMRLLGFTVKLTRRT